MVFHYSKPQIRVAVGCDALMASLECPAHSRARHNDFEYCWELGGRVGYEYQAGGFALGKRRCQLRSPHSSYQDCRQRRI